MIYILENEKLRVKISSMGAELQSIVNVADEFEYLWQGDSTYWGNRATNIFPTCGRMVEGKYTFEGKTYDMQIHGLVRTQEWSVINQKANTITLQCKSDASTLACYPFNYTIEMTYTLNDGELGITWIVHNDDEKTMIFAVGNHPGFNLPMNSDKKFEDYYLEFDEPCGARQLAFSSDCFYTNASVPFPLENGKVLHLTHGLFDDDGVFLKDTCLSLTLRTADDNAHKIHMNAPDMKFIGLWHKPLTEAPYVCVEPWLGVPALSGHINDLTEIPEMEKLEAGKVYRNSQTMKFE